MTSIRKASNVRKSWDEFPKRGDQASILDLPDSYSLLLVGNCFAENKISTYFLDAALLQSFGPYTVIEPCKVRSSAEGGNRGYGPNGSGRMQRRANTAQGE